MKLTGLVWGLALFCFPSLYHFYHQRRNEMVWKSMRSQGRSRCLKKCFTLVDWVDVLKFLEGADVLRRLWKKGGIFHSSLFSFLQSEFQFLQWGARISHRSSKNPRWRLKTVGCAGWAVNVWFRFKWLCPNHVASSASSSISWDTGAWVRFCRGEVFW